MRVKACEHLSGLAKDMCEIEHMAKMIESINKEKADKKLCKAQERTNKADERVKRADRKGVKYE